MFKNNEVTSLFGSGRVKQGNDAPIYQIDRDLLEDEKVRNEIPEGVKVEVIGGDRFDINSLKIDEAVPSTRQFTVFKYKNPRTQRIVKILKCDHEGCGMFFRKWHNFFDHLRVHTRERPFKCRHTNCD